MVKLLQGIHYEFHALVSIQGPFTVVIEPLQVEVSLGVLIVAVNLDILEAIFDHSRMLDLLVTALSWLEELFLDHLSDALVFRLLV